MEAYEQQVSAAATTDYKILEETDSLAGITPVESITENAGMGNEVGSTGTEPSENLLAHIRDKETAIKKELEQAPETEVDKEKSVSGKTVSNARNEEKGFSKKKQTPEENEQTREVNQQRALTTGIAELDKVFDENMELNRQNDSLKFYLKQADSRLQKIEAENSRKFTVSKKGASGFGTKEQPGSQVVKAEIYETTTVLDGNRVKLRLLEEAWVNGIKVPQGSIVYGVCAIRNERLNISITQFPARESFLTVDLAVHDVDGLPGLYVPDNAARKATKDALAGTNTSSMIGVTTDPLTYAGIRAADRTAQTLLKSIRLKRVTVKKNTIVYIINQKTKS
jgi:hypothetical protein